MTITAKIESLTENTKVEDKKEETMTTTVTEQKIDLSADIAALTEGHELTEEFKAHAATIFEAAVVSRVKTEVERLTEENEQRLQKQFEETAEGLVEQVDGYLNYMVEKWMEDNALALESGIKSEITENFVAGLKGLFEQHYIDIPEEKYDVLGEMTAEIESLKKSLDEAVADTVELKKALNESAKAEAIEEATKGLTDVDAEKFKTLAEELVFEESDSFKAKLKTIRESYFEKKQSTVVTEAVVTDAPVLTEEVEAAPAAPALTGAQAAYVGFLDKQKK